MALARVRKVVITVQGRQKVLTTKKFLLSWSLVAGFFNLYTSILAEKEFKSKYQKKTPFIFVLNKKDVVLAQVKSRYPTSQCFLKQDKLYVDNRMFVWRVEESRVVEQTVVTLPATPGNVFPGLNVQTR